MNTAHRALLFAAFVMGITVVAPTPVEAAPKTHTVAAGQSLWKIAHRYHVSVDALCRENGINEADAVRAGQVLTIPDGKAKASRKPPSRPGHKAAPPDNKPDTGHKRGAKPSGGLPPLAKAVPASSPAKPAHASSKPTHAVSKSSLRHKVADKKTHASEPSRGHKGSTEPAAAKSHHKSSLDSDEGD